MFPPRASVLFVLVGWILFAQVSHRLAAEDKVPDWPQFRGPGGQGRSTDTGLPERWTATKNIAWTADLSGVGSSSPIVVGQRVYLTCDLGYGVPGEPGNMEQLVRRVVCLWVKDGTVLWQVDVEPKLPEHGWTREGHGYSSSTLASDGNWLYAFFGKSGVYAFDELGRRKWRSEVGSKTDDWGSATSPVLFGNLVIVNASVESEALVALDKKSGKLVWRLRGIKESWNTPILVDVEEGKQELVLAIRGSVLGFNPETGEQLWRCGTDIGWYMVPSLVAQDGVVYCIGGRSGGGLAVRAGGRGDVTESHRLWTIDKGSNVSSPVLHDGYLYWMHESRGVAYCVEAKSGKVVYEQRVDGADQVYASAVAGDGKLYYVTRSGQTFVLASKPEFELLARNDVRDRNYFNASPAIAGGQLFLRSDRTLYCIGQCRRVTE